MALFSYYLFQKEFSRKVLNIILACCSIFVGVSLFASYYIYTFPVRYYQVIMLLATFYGLAVYVKATIKRRTGRFIIPLRFLRLSYNHSQ